uniref:CD80-like immunoglobulin C2-set domain-containing protein n=1 Tax=Glossina austeni TaxID=7395 RepID=A0A1A9VNT9_GLOAU
MKLVIKNFNSSELRLKTTSLLFYFMINHSNASHVWLSKVPLAISELPTQRPIITGIHSRYRLGDNIDGNCSLDYTKPAANLTWWINDIQVPPNYLRIYDKQKHEGEQLESAVLEINFVVTLQHFIKGRLKLKCSARIYRIYHGETEKYIEEDKPRIMASGRSPEMYPFDHNNDEFEESNDENGLYLTRYNEYASSSAWKEKPTLLWLLINGFLISYWRTVKSSKEIILHNLTNMFILCKKPFTLVMLVCETAGKLTGNVMNSRHTLAKNYYKTRDISRHQR